MLFDESIQILRKAGYRFIIVSECTGINPYNCELCAMSRQKSVLMTLSIVPPAQGLGSQEDGMYVMFFTIFQ